MNFRIGSHDGPLIVELTHSEYIKMMTGPVIRPYVPLIIVSNTPKPNMLRRKPRLDELPDLSRHPPDKDFEFEDSLGLDSYYQIQTDYVRAMYAGEKAWEVSVDVGGEG